MLPSPTLPATWRGLLEMFRPAFRRSRTFGLFVLLATGLVAQAARRTVVGMLVGAGVAAVVSFHACCRFFSHHRWDVDRIGLVLARLIVDRLLDAGAPIVVVVDLSRHRDYPERARSWCGDRLRERLIGEVLDSRYRHNSGIEQPGVWVM